ncbi:helix-turn-helix domain-containing protein [Amycolatopsis sp. DG1A-15b]|jgi:transcriptional regulator with XRE-family HTH domain|uniref:helix-turn-helix domain-containing protein n=1 Tax=Amycolatopsis sp. DG1A-15b TaxID=3052846 RepID=UPI00255BFC3B|nr:helix-turn-helix domain-containing protein [Amycolatopsis sp. DG1A-15b]WIX93373.1 helix-turn-helix domain-containing protein [Amycolatopsis sp. DG1A-15b]
MPQSSPGGERTLAAKIDHLFRTVRPRSGKEYSFEEVAEAIRGSDGASISATYLWQLRKGVRDNPTRRHLEALARFFGVPPAYFFDESTATQVDAELALLAALRDASVRQIALRASGLSPKTLSAITQLVERAREIEGLPDEG